MLVILCRMANVGWQDPFRGSNSCNNRKQLPVFRPVWSVHKIWDSVP